MTGRRTFREQILHPDQVPDCLYHYTTAEGLLGIFNDGAIWATDPGFLNDASEEHSAWQLLARRAEEFQSRVLRQPDSAAKAVSRARLTAVRECVAHHTDVKGPFVCSFSTNGDLLSQWRAYGGLHSGYAIGFDGKALRRFADANGFMLAPCLYTTSHQEALADDMLQEILDRSEREHLIDPFLPSRLDLDSEDVDAMDSEFHFRRLAHRWASCVKNDEFREEGEWRLAATEGGGPLKFRIRQGLLVPYQALGCPTNLICRVVVGPSAYAAQACAGVRSLVRSKGLDPDVQVAISQIPYRG